MNFVSFPDIKLFHNVVKFKNETLEIYPGLFSKPIAYRGKIKLHGTNAGVRVKDGEVVAQSRERIITPTEDNAGFAKWVETRKSFFQKLDRMTIFGEWCGPGINSGTALQKIRAKQFAVFAIVLDPEKDVENHENVELFTYMINDPVEIASVLGELPEDVKILPWYGEEFTIDYLTKESMQKAVDFCNGVVETVEKCDPWVKENFGIEGVGEGVVYYPLNEVRYSRKYFSNFAFKAKGEEHQVVRSKAPVQIDPEVAASIDDFVKMFVTEARLEQGASKVDESFDIKNIGLFIKWVTTDVLKESVAELEASNLTWAQVQRSVSTAARSWYMEKNKVIV